MYLFLAHGSFFAKCLKAPQKITGVFVPGTELPLLVQDCLLQKSMGAKSNTVAV